MSCLVMVRPASGPIAVRPYSACRFSIALRSAPFRMRRRRPTCGGTLIRAYRARAGGCVAPARFARLIGHACTRARAGSGAGTLLPSASPALFASARVEAISGRRFLPPHLGTSVHGVKRKIRNISDNLNKLQFRAESKRIEPQLEPNPKLSPRPPSRGPEPPSKPGEAPVVWTPDLRSAPSGVTIEAARSTSFQLDRTVL